MVEIPKPFEVYEKVRHHSGSEVWSGFVSSSDKAASALETSPSASSSSATKMAQCQAVPKDAAIKLVFRPNEELLQDLDFEKESLFHDREMRRIL